MATEEAVSEKTVFAFSKCSNIERKGNSSFNVTCNICGLQVITSTHKLMYGHYLRKKNQNMSKYCVSISVLQRDHPAFFKELEQRWDALQVKREQSIVASTVAKKQKIALEVDGHSLKLDYAASNEATVVNKGKDIPTAHTAMGWALLPAEKKNALREECQTAWDTAFVVCGISFSAANNPVFRAAIEKTRAIPDFKLVCSSTMSTTRLDKLAATADNFKECRLRAGQKFGFLITSDGWRSAAKRNYHNYILVSVEGSIFLGLEEVTGEGGTGEDIAKQFESKFNELGEEITKRVLIGVTDTPSSNQKAWRLLEASHPHQFWIGCAAHEISLLFKEWVKKVPDITQLFKEGLRVVKWVNNHSEILKLYREAVKRHFPDNKRKHSLMLYMPGDTRMLSVFKMLHRILVLWDVLADVCNSAEYEVASQKALKAWSDQQKAEDKLVPVEGRFMDRVKHSFTNGDFKKRTEGFISVTKSVVYLKSLVDGQTPVLGKFYYCCALVDKHLRVLKEEQRVPYIEQMRAIFSKRWKRWHRPIHTFAYAVDPCYQTHELTAEERADCSKVIKKLGGVNWPSLKVEFDRWRDSGQSIFPKEVWDSADNLHGYQWWDSFGDDFRFLNRAAADVLSKPISASACEFNWSDVGHVVNKRSQRLSDDKIEKKVNVRAMHKLNNMVNRKILLGGIPKLDDVLDSLVQAAIDESLNGGDDVADPDAQLAPDSSDDEHYDVVAENEEPLYELGGTRSNAMERDLMVQV